MRKTKKHALIAKLYKKHLKTITDLQVVLDTLPMAGEYCNCGDELEMGIMDSDVSFDDGTASLQCMSCGGYWTT